MPTDLYILGSGLNGPLQMTTETIQALAVCREVYVLHDDGVVIEAVKKHAPIVHDLAKVYERFSERRDVYEHIAEIVVAAALEEPTVAFICHGHPLFLVSASEYMVRFARQNKLKVRVLPAVSSFDTIMCDLNLDFGYKLQIFDATTLVNEQHDPNPRLPLIVFNLASFLNDFVVYAEPGSETLTSLVSHLLKTYSNDQECTLIHSATHVLESSNTAQVQLSDLNKHCPIDLWKRPTLYIPAEK